MCLCNLHKIPLAIRAPFFLSTQDETEKDFSRLQYPPNKHGSDRIYCLFLSRYTSCLVLIGFPVELRLVTEYLSDEDLILQQMRRLESWYYCSLSLISAKPLLGKNPRKFFFVPCPGGGGSFRGKGGVKGGERKRLINSILFAEKNARITKSPG